MPVSALPVTATPVPSAPPPAYYPPPAYPAAAGYSVAGYGGGYYAYPGYPPVDPTGVPYSDKSKVTAGLLQLLLGLLLALGGIGRLYAGNTALGATQLVLAVVGWIALFCVPFVGFLIFFGLWVWFWVDGIVMLAGRPVDGYGRPLR